MSDLTARDIHELDQAAVDAASDVDALADDPETTLRLAGRGPAVYAAQLTADLAAAADDRPMTLAAFAAWQTIRRVQERAELRAEVERLRAERETDYKAGHADASMAEGWERVAGELEHEAEVAALHAERDGLRAALAASNDGDGVRLSQAEQRVSLAQGLAARWAGDKDVLLASAGRELLRATGGA